MAVAVLMSTYNGEKYVAEQIDSILAQDLKGGSVCLYVRDDGSADATVKILMQYVSRYENIKFINQEEVENVGILKSFLSLLEYAYRDSENNYFAFADQDDVWFSDKLYAAVQMLEEKGVDQKGRLYYSNKRFVDKELNTICNENIPFYDDIYEVFWTSLASGCTMVFDRQLAQYVTRHYPSSPTIHDSWIYRLAKCIGSTVVFDRKPHILYRQHGDNVIGMEGAQLYHDSIGYWFRMLLPFLFMKREHKKLQNIGEIYKNYQAEISEENRKVITTFLRYRTNLISKYKMIHNKYIKKRDKKGRAVWAFSVIFNRL